MNAYDLEGNNDIACFEGEVIGQILISGLNPSADGQLP